VSQQVAKCDLSGARIGRNEMLRIRERRVYPGIRTNRFPLMHCNAQHHRGERFRCRAKVVHTRCVVAGEVFFEYQLSVPSNQKRVNGGRIRRDRIGLLDLVHESCES
jgi:hypothetical protein